MALSCAAAGCSNDAPSPAATLADRQPHSAKTGVLLVSHGSHSAEWRRMLTEFGDEVETEMRREIPAISGVKSAFMEYTEPSIASRMKEFDDEGYDQIILVPLLLTVSSHSFDDIPTIIGAKEDKETILNLEAEGIERFKPQASVEITPLFDFSELLLQNLPRRFARLSENPAEEGIVLVAYGSEPFDQEWESFFSHLDAEVQKATGVADVVHCWCGHIARYSGKPTQEAIHTILEDHPRAVVLPVLVARDENFQEKIIGGAIDELPESDQVAYASDAILPDKTLNEWVIAISRQTLEEGFQRSSTDPAEATP